MSEDIKLALLTLPTSIATTATQILTLQTGKGEVDVKIAEIETAVKFQIGTDASLKNDTARRGAIQDLLAQNKDYTEKVKEQSARGLQLDLARIEYQRLRDSMNCLIAIAGMS